MSQRALRAALALTLFASVVGPPRALADEGAEPESCAEPEPHSWVALSLSVLPRVDGWDPIYGHRDGWGIAGAVEFSPWSAHTQIHLEVTYLTNREQRLISADLGLKVPFHTGARWEVHGVIGPAIAYEHFQHTHEDGTTRESAFVVGMVAAVGVTYWFHRDVRAMLDLNYRVLGGEGIAHRLFTAVGLASRW